MKDETITVVNGQDLTTTSRSPIEVASYLIVSLYDALNYEVKSTMTVDKYTGECEVKIDGDLNGTNVSISFTVSAQ